MRYLPEARKVSSGADKTESGLKVTVQVKNRVPENWEDFVLECAGGNEDRATEWLRSQVISDQNVSVRSTVKALEINAGETEVQFLARAQKEGQADVDSWNVERTRREGTGHTSRAKAADAIADAFAANKTPDEIAEMLKQYREKFGVAIQKEREKEEAK